MAVPGSISSVASGDVDFDGNADLVLSDSGGNLVLLPGNGDGTFDAEDRYPAGQIPHSLALKDLNNDGAPDVEVVSSGGLSVFLNTGGTSVTLTQPGQTSANQPVTFAATVAATVTGSGSPTGSVTFKDVSVHPVVALGTVSLINGTATLIKGFAAGTRYIQAEYNGNATFNRKLSNVASILVTPTSPPGGTGGKGGANACSLPAQAPPQATQLRTQRKLSALGSGAVGKPSAAADSTLALAIGAEQPGTEHRQDLRLAKPYLPDLRRWRRAAKMPRVRRPAELATAPDVILGFDGINHLEQRNADNGNQATLEPPDMALAASNTQVVQVVNGALAVYSTAGIRLAGPTALNPFFGQASAVNRTGPMKVFGPFVADPRVLFDSVGQRWVIVALKVDVNPVTGAWLHTSSILLAVSQTTDATGQFTFYSIDVTDPGFGNCPCIGDQPLLGINDDAVFISTNLFSFLNRSFQTALVLAIDKGLLYKRGKVAAVGFQNLTASNEPAFSVQPAIPAPGTSSSPGVQFFLSTLNFSGNGDNRLAVWAMLDTRRLLYANQGLVRMLGLVVTTQSYQNPTPVSQMSGPTPLLNSLSSGQPCDDSGITSPPSQEPLEQLDANDDRMQQVYRVGGELIAAFGTRVQLTTTRMGVSWLRIGATADACTLTATVNQQGYLAVEGTDLLFPAVAINANGQGVIGLTVAGQSNFPSFGYARMDNTGVNPAVQIPAAGSAPEDGFSGYHKCGGEGIARWGDYSAATVSPDGNLWTAGEYIPNSPRTTFANWGSHIVRITPQ